MSPNPRERGESPHSGDEEGEVDAEVFRLAMEKAPTAMIIVDAGGSMVAVNQAAERLFGYRAEELLGRPVEVLLPKPLRTLHQELRGGFLETPENRPMGQQRDLLAMAGDGSTIPVEIGLSSVETSSGPMVVCSIVDLSAREEAERRMAEVVELLETQNERLLELVATDVLTSLKSRRAFMEHLGAQLEVAVRHARPLSLLIIDIDHFKHYNDEFGHLAGDEVLRQMGGVLGEVSRRSDFVARLGGEEFGVVLPETDADGARTLAERFRGEIEAADWPRRGMTVSVGAATVTFSRAIPRPNTPNLSEILREADRALYRSKEAGRNRITHVEDM